MQTLVKTNKMVILLHGISRTKKSMRYVEKALVKENYRVLNLDYPSRKKNLSALALEIYEQIQSFINQREITLDFISHSMGALVIRELLTHHQIDNLGRIVMIAPPNQGSEIADFLKDNIFYKKYFGPAGQQLTTQYAQSNIFHVGSREIGIIAGNQSIAPLAYFLLSELNDGRVTVEKTKLTGMKEHIIVSTNHTFIIANKKVIAHALNFLQYGTFSPSF